MRRALAISAAVLITISACTLTSASTALAVDVPAGQVPLPFAPQVTLAMELVLKDAVSVNGERIFLSDVAECRGSKALCEEMYGVDLGKSPPIGKVSRLKKTAIADLVKSEWPHAQIDLQGSEVVTISSTVFEITGSDIESALQRVLDAKLRSHENIKIIVQAAHLNRNLKVIGSDNFFAFPEIEKLNLHSDLVPLRSLIGTTRVEVQIQAGLSREILLSTRISVTLQVEMLVAVANRDLDRGTIISSQYFSKNWVSLSRDRESIVEEIEPYNGFKLARRIFSGEPIRRSYLVLPQAMKSGQIVDVVVSTGGLEINTKGKVLKGGAVGETVEVVLQGTQKRGSAKIINREQVILQ